MHYNEKRKLFCGFCESAVGVLSVLFWILLAFGLEEGWVAGLSVIAATVHEGAHAAVMAVTKRGGGVRGNVGGFRIRTEGGRQSALLFLSGSVANFMLAAAAVPFLVFGASEYALGFALINIATGLTNLLPIRGFDGYGLIRHILDERCARRGWYDLLSGVSFGITVAFLLFSLYLLARVGEGYWTFASYFVLLEKELYRCRCKEI